MYFGQKLALRTKAFVCVCLHKAASASQTADTPSPIFTLSISIIHGDLSADKQMNNRNTYFEKIFAFLKTFKYSSFPLLLHKLFGIVA